MRILLAEDNTVNQLLAKKILEKAGCSIDIASNGAEALEYLRAIPYDLVLMDIQMPEMDGYEASQKIRRELPDPISRIPIIAMTAHAFGSDVTRCLEAGMNDYVSKPFKARDLYDKILSNLDAEREAKVVNLDPAKKGHAIDLEAMKELGMNDASFIEGLVLAYERQTPVFAEKLRGYTGTRNYAAIRQLCHQIKSSYGILRMAPLEKVLEELSSALDAEKTPAAIIKLTRLVSMLISLIIDINDQVRRNLKKTG